MDHAEPSLSGADLAEEFAAALDWWREAGVDNDYADDATEWLTENQSETAEGSAQVKPARPRKQPAAPPPPKKIGGDKNSWPAELPAFQQWFTSDPSIDDGGAYPPVAPSGPAQPALMVIVAEPEENDSESLLSGPQGRLVTGMLRAAGVARDEIYIASVLRRHTPMPDWDGLRGSGIGELLAHHVGLVGPKRILTFGRNIPPLLGNDTAQGAALLHNFNHDGDSIPVLGVGSLPELLRSAPRRQRFWQRWLEWTDG